MVKTYPWCLGNIIKDSEVCWNECPYENICFHKTYFVNYPKLVWTNIQKARNLSQMQKSVAIQKWVQKVWKKKL